MWNKLKKIYKSDPVVGAKNYKDMIGRIKVAYTTVDGVDKEFTPFSDDILKMYMLNIYRNRKLFFYDNVVNEWAMLYDYIYSYVNENLDDIKKVLSGYYSDYNPIDNYNGVIHQVTVYGATSSTDKQIQDGYTQHERQTDDVLTTKRTEDETHKYTYDDATGEQVQTLVSGFNNPSTQTPSETIKSTGGHSDAIKGGEVKNTSSGGDFMDSTNMGEINHSTDAHTDTYDETKRGNLGVTTSAQMLESEIDMRLNNFFTFRFAKGFFELYTYDL